MDTSPAQTDDLVTAIDNEGCRMDEMQRALQIRIKQAYNCAEEPVTTLRAPFLGFSVFVRFQSRAKVHHVRLVQASELEAVTRSGSSQVSN